MDNSYNCRYYGVFAGVDKILTAKTVSSIFLHGSAKGRREKYYRNKQKKRLSFLKTLAIGILNMLIYQCSYLYLFFSKEKVLKCRKLQLSWEA